MKPQPDFTAIFFDYFGRSPKPVSYALRFDSSLLHDIQFMSSLLHDADIRPQTFLKRGKRLTIRLMRECWELPKVKRDGAVHLHVVESTLVVSPAREAVWTLPHDCLQQGQQSFSMQQINIGLDYWDPEKSSFNLILQGPSWRCDIAIDSKSPLVRVRDVGVPRLYGEAPGQSAQ
jgi:hypothetical protein